MNPGNVRAYLQRESAREWITRIFPGFEWTPHVSQLLEAMMPLTQAKRLRMVVCWPPRHGKTTTVLLMLAYLAVHWRVRIAYASYSTKMAEKKAVEMRRIFEGAGVSVTGTLEQLAIPSTGSTLTMRGIDAGWTGLGFDVLVCDDPLDGRDEAESVVIRDRRFDALKADFLSRLDFPNKTGVILIQTRWHMEDPAGRAMRGDLGEPYQIQLARAQNEAGASLWPERFPPDELAIIRARGEYDWWSLYQQEPRPRGTELFREPARYELGPWLSSFDPHMWRWAIALDPAASEETHADHSVALLLAMKGTGDDAEARVVDLERGQWEVPDLCQRVKRLRARWVARGVTCSVHIEGVGGFKAVGQVLRGLMPAECVVPAKVSGDKFTRALPVSAAWNTKRVSVPTDAPWADQLISECVRFTGIGDSQDDQVDALAYAWKALERRKPELVRGRAPLRIHTMG